MGQNSQDNKVVGVAASSKRARLKAQIKALNKATAQLMELKSALEGELEQLNTAGRRRHGRPRIDLPPAAQLRREYEALLDNFAENGREALREFVQTHSTHFLDAFITANGLPLELRRSKDETERALHNQLMNSLLIRGKDSPV